MATTLGELSRRVSELRSRIAVIEGLVRYTATNYLSGSGGHISAEMRFSLEGGSWVPEEHVVLASEELEELVAGLRVELSTLESMNIDVPVLDDVEAEEEVDEAPEPESASDEETVAVGATPLRKKKADAAVRQTGSEDPPLATPRQGVA